MSFAYQVCLTCQRCNIHDCGCAALLLRVPERICKRQAALRICTHTTRVLTGRSATGHHPKCLKETTCVASHVSAMGHTRQTVTFACATDSLQSLLRSVLMGVTPAPSSPPPARVQLQILVHYRRTEQGKQAQFTVCAQFQGDS